MIIIEATTNSFTNTLMQIIIETRHTIKIFLPLLWRVCFYIVAPGSSYKRM